MKIVCDSCATKYSISDDKVRGKVFKIRCKKCSHIIVVRGTADAAAAPAAAATAESGGWHLVVDGEQVGPLPEAEIRARLGRGEINGETYIWKEGLADWLKLATVPEFADAASPGAQPTDVAGGAGDLFTDSAPLSRGGEAQVQVDEAMVASSAPAPSVARVGGGGGGLFSAVDAAAASAAVSPARVGRGSADHDDGFGAPMAARGGGGDLFASHAASSAAAEEGGGRRGAGANHDGGRVENLTAQRHENSVLFSLANLQQLAMPTVAPKASAPVTNGNGSSEGSGLIDIRAMAATTMGGPSASGGGSGGLSDDLPTFGSFSAAAPVLLPIPTQSGPPKWMYAVIGGMVILVVGIAVMAYKILTTKPVTEIVQVPVPAPAPPPTAVAVAPKAAATPTTPGAAAIPEDKLPPREGEPGGEPAKAAGDGAKHDKGAGHEKKSGKGGGKDKKGGASADTGGGKAAPAAAAAAPEPEKKGPAKGSLDDLLDNALSGKSKTRNRAAASDDDAPAPRRAAAPPPEAAGPLSKSAVVAGMNAIKPKINDCYNQYKVPGMAMVMVVIGKNGKVSSASVSGKFAGTPSGACVEKAVKSASFPPSEGLSTPYPFQLK
jgi:predicted Zn finger-like uncharacterized protein